MALIVLPGILKDKFGEAVAQALVDLINQMAAQAKDQTVEVVEDRFERRLTEEIGRLRVDMEKIRADLIKWMFIFWVGQVGTITAILFVFFK
ncbi:MAG: hypothetical protein A3G87_04955 [Omnitrophica bacterium RIFCSPLOWO2_12_FULL_50_11]|nr:MAG: hypothetical protein A3G87_04955 [Omnitrophica bacterium RIFCSPLOWO2_12_FULL_50_11]